MEYAGIVFYYYYETFIANEHKTIIGRGVPAAREKTADHNNSNNEIRFRYVRAPHRDNDTILTADISCSAPTAHRRTRLGPT